MYMLEATIRKLREDQFEAEMSQVELKSERDIYYEQEEFNILVGAVKTIFKFQQHRSF